MIRLVHRAVLNIKIVKVVSVDITTGSGRTRGRPNARMIAPEKAAYDSSLAGDAVMTTPLLSCATMRRAFSGFQGRYFVEQTDFVAVIDVIFSGNVCL